ncbi:type II toxin-antitoxin system Phd/YefM family antitoxin [Duganella sp. FT135W]|uniref:Antitoxin n=1 Tax=Duganella flavida TaxID=2692175 RepID=A0A6L8KCP4_9BURK|nr:type II toxin-antitoxin system Phd/YefM family antitoxin [Duganella flavida]MYM25233.1 type II toxin-antitoxin system Phd/YefM family antitoxin [Duganella flavida]
MTSTTLSSREFNQQFNKPAKAVINGPVFVTEQGQTSYVLLNFKDYQRLIREHSNMAELLSVPELAANIDFDPPRSAEIARGADLS